jgi:hypothetical protein
VSIRMMSNINVTRLIKELIPRRDSERKDRETGQAQTRLKYLSCVSPFKSDTNRGT